MVRRQGWVATLLALVALGLFPTQSQAQEARSVGYVLSVHLGVTEKLAEGLVQELSDATSTWHAHTSPHGAKVATDCAATPSCIERASKEMGVTRIGIVAVVAAAGAVRLDVRLYDAATGNELQRTHLEYEEASEASKAIYDLIPRLLPGEKSAPPPPPDPPVQEPQKIATPTPLPTPIVVAPLSPPQENNIDLSTPPKQEATRWWLWGGIGVGAASLGIVALLLLQDDSPSGPVLELPPPQ